MELTEDNLESQLERLGYCLLPSAIAVDMAEQLRQICAQTLEENTDGILAKSSRGHIYAARNLIDTIPEIRSCWKSGPMYDFLVEVLGPNFGLVRALFFDKPPDRTWALAWHKDTAIAVAENTVTSSKFSRPTVKAGVPHVIACDEILRQMLTMRIHLDEVTDENGPLRVIPASHHSSDSVGWGVEKAETVHAAVGDVLAMRPLITHGSGSSMPGTTRHRRILHLEFASMSQLPDNYRWYRFEPATEW